MRKAAVSRTDRAGFTLLEVLASVVIAGTALTVLLLERNRTVQLVSETDAMRLAAMLASEKMGEIAVGTETAGSGTFQQREGYSWSVSESSAVLGSGPDQVACPLLELTVTYWGGKRSVTLKSIARRKR